MTTKTIHLLVLLICVVLTAAVAAADTPPDAVAVGQQACITCHDELGAQFAQSVHARVKKFEMRRGHQADCESCHGAGSVHAKEGDPKQIFGYKQVSARDANARCLSCHTDGMGHNWATSDHGMTGLACTECHQIHQSRKPFATANAVAPGLKPVYKNAPPPAASLKKPEPQLCLGCHKEKTGQMMLTSHHPVREGKMKCSSCHSAHGSQVKQLKSEERTSDLCLSCHTAKQGPFVFEHAPVSENCMTCHEPHGTIANNLLRQNEPFLCLQCHEAHFHVGRSGVTNTLVKPNGATSANPYGEAGWRNAFATKCTQCHSQVHGSDLPSQSVAGRGAALTR